MKNSIKLVLYFFINCFFPPRLPCFVELVEKFLTVFQGALSGLSESEREALLDQFCFGDFQKVPVTALYNVSLIVVRLSNLATDCLHVRDILPVCLWGYSNERIHKQNDNSNSHKLFSSFLFSTCQGKRTGKHIRPARQGGKSQKRFGERCYET